MTNLTDRWRWDPAIGEALLEKYAEPHRHYHTAEHLRAMFTLLDEHPQAVAAVRALSDADREAVELALWYHDREYDPRGKMNEERSALQFAADAEALGVPHDVRARVNQLILISRHHRPPADDACAALFCDLDLSILGASPEAYAAYARGVRLEYAHVDDTAYAFGRRRVLEGFLKRPRIYHALLDREGTARRNIVVEMEALPSVGYLELLSSRLTRASSRPGNEPLSNETWTGEKTP